jgi:hypothetical protein
MSFHAYRLVFRESPQTPERLWEWEKVHVGRLLWNATAFGRKLTYRKIKRTFATAPAGNVEWLQRHGGVSRVFPPYPSVNIFA